MRFPEGYNASVFAVAISNIGATSEMEIEAISAGRDAVALTLCETNSQTGDCIEAPDSGEMTISLASGGQRTFGDLSPAGYQVAIGQLV